LHSYGLWIYHARLRFYFCLSKVIQFEIKKDIKIFFRYQAAAVSYHHQENAIVRNFSRSSMPEGADPESLLASTKKNSSD